MLTITQAAAKIGIHIQTLHSMIQRGAIKPRRIGSQYVLSESQIVRIKKRARGRPRKK